MGTSAPDRQSSRGLERAAAGDSTLAAAPAERVGTDRRSCLELADPRTCEIFYPSAPRKAGAFWLMTSVLVLGLAGGTLPSPLYPLYQSRFGFSNTIVTVIYSVYAAGVLGALLAVGRSSDTSGRRPVLLAAAALAAVSTVLFVVAQDLAVLLVARFTSGLAVGLLTGTATAALAELEPAGNKTRASLFSASGTPAGLALGSLLAGALAQYAPLPIRLVYLVYFGAIAAIVAVVLLVPETVPGATHRLTLKPQGLRVPPRMRRRFLVAAAGVFASFAVSGIFSALAPSFLGQTLHQRNHLVGGLPVVVSFGAAATAAPLMRRWSIRRVGSISVVATLIGLSLVLVGLWRLSLSLFVAGSVLSGFGLGGLFESCLALVNRDAPPEHRAEVVSAFFVAAYLGLTVPVVGLGLGSQHVGALRAAEILSAVVAALCVATLVGMARLGDRPPAAAAEELGGRDREEALAPARAQPTQALERVQPAPAGADPITARRASAARATAGRPDTAPAERLETAAGRATALVRATASVRATAEASQRSLVDTTVLITGSTDGVGKLVAQRLAAAGATVLLHGRSREKGEAVLAEIRAATGSAKLQYFLADLSSLEEVRRLASQVQERRSALHVLINNAGIGTGRSGQREISRDGYELRFAVNYLAPFLLTHLLLPSILSSAPARIVNVASAGQVPLDLADLMLRGDYEGRRAYRQSKLAQIMFTFDLARQLRGTGVTVNALHPATLMDTKMVREGWRNVMSTVEEGADAIVYVASAPDTAAVTGRYFNGKKPGRADEQAYDASARRQLWDMSTQLTGLTHQTRRAAGGSG
jgi:NAD(P)-dependent dehydrogenase (short-subunit alcohol dehydrogenase family)/MFS family permease